MKGPKVFDRKSRKAVEDTQKDTYISEEGLRESECKVCGSIYYDKRWTLPGEAPAHILEKPKEKIVCPACRKTSDRFAEGFITIIDGEFFKKHKDEITHLIRNTEKKAMHFNPLDRIEKIVEKADGIEVTTTTEKLAERIGRMIEKTFHEDVEYRWSSGVARVILKKHESKE